MRSTAPVSSLGPKAQIVQHVIQKEGEKNPKKRCKVKRPTNLTKRQKVTENRIGSFDINQMFPKDEANTIIRFPLFQNAIFHKIYFQYFPMFDATEIDYQRKIFAYSTENYNQSKK